MAEAPEPFLSELGEAMLCLTDGLLLLETCLGEELVGIADELFFEGFGQIVLLWQWQVLRNDVLTRQSCSRVALTDPCVALQSLAAQHGCAKYSVTDIGLGAETFDSGRVATDDADIVEHGCLLYELTVERHFWVGINYSESLLCDSA